MSDWLIGTGQMAEEIRNFGWAQTNLGPRQEWPFVLQTMVNAMIATPVPTLITWGEKQLSLFNDSYLKITKDKHRGAIGKPIPEIWSAIWPKIGPAFERVMQHRESVFLEDIAFPSQLQNTTQYCTWFTIFCSPIYIQSGQVGGVQITLVETTERRQLIERISASEARLNEAQRLAHIGNWELDVCTDTLWWSDEIYRLFELTRETFKASYIAFLDTIHPEDREKVNRAYTDSLVRRTPYEMEHRLKMHDGRIKFVLERCENYYDENGKAIRSIGTV
jgi:PAS domain-containing protein